MAKRLGYACAVFSTRPSLASVKPLVNTGTMTIHKLSPLDVGITLFDQGLRTVFGRVSASARALPRVEEEPLSSHEKDTSVRLMRVNHAGEVAAQALYRGHALTAREPKVRAHMERGAREESDHLAWCEARIDELGGRTSALNPLWYIGSLAIGALAGRAGDKWSLGFVVETERQVVKHLDGHLARLPPRDAASRVILEQMRQDEAHHGSAALSAGAAPLPTPVKTLMGFVSKIMTRTAYWI